MADRIFHKRFVDKNGVSVYLCNKIMKSHRVTDDIDKVNCNKCLKILGIGWYEMNVLDRAILSILFAAVILRPIDANWIYCLLTLVIFFVWEGMIQLMYKVYGKNIVEGWYEKWYRYIGG